MVPPVESLPESLGRSSPVTTTTCSTWVAAMALATVGLVPPSATAQVGDALVVVSKRTVTTTGYADIAARCPAGYVALSGGISSGSAWTVTTLAPTFGNLALFQLADGVQAGAPDGWYASVDMLEGPSTIALAVSCAQLSGPVVTVVESGQAAYYSDVSATAQCPANTRALGGGIDVERADTLSSEKYRISASHPQSDGSDQSYPPSVGWRAGVYGAPLLFVVPPPPGPVFKVGAVCAQGTDARIASSFDATSSNYGVFRESASCPAGTGALAGGSRVPGQWLVGLEPVFGDDSALALYQRNPGSYPVGPGWSTGAIRDTGATNTGTGFNAYAVCAATNDAGAAAPAVPVVEFYHAGLHHYFISTDPVEIAALQSGAVIKGWTATGLAWKAHVDQPAGTQPVCRFYIPPGLGDSHFFSASASECAAILDASTNPAHPSHAWYAGYVHESPNAFYVTAPAQGGTCVGGTTAVYRLWNGQANAAAWGSNHRYTTSPAIVSQMVGEGYVNEGVVMCSPD